MWYVIQTKTGKEELIQSLIESTVPADLYEDCKIIRREKEMKIRGETKIVQKVQFPGYLFLVTDQIREIRQCLKKIPLLTKILGYGEELVPIKETEEEKLRSVINEENVIVMSYGLKDGDRIIVTEGALFGKESLIQKVNSHKRTAYIRVEILGEERSVEVGLDTVTKKEIETV